MNLPIGLPLKNFHPGDPTCTWCKVQESVPVLACALPLNPGGRTDRKTVEYVGSTADPFRFPTSHTASRQLRAWDSRGAVKTHLCYEDEKTKRKQTSRNGGCLNNKLSVLARCLCHGTIPCSAHSCLWSFQLTVPLNTRATCEKLEFLTNLTQLTCFKGKSLVILRLLYWNIEFASLRLLT